MLTPASTATSSRRRPGTRRLLSWTGRPTCCGVILARRVARNWRTSSLLSTTTTLRPLPGLVGGPVITWNAVTFRIVVATGSMADMTDKKIWFITGAARGMGVDIAKAALAAGNAVVATARNADTVTAALGEHDDLMAVTLDITDPASAEAAVQTAVERFGRIDVLVNNAGNFYAGYFEEISPAQMRAQIETNLFGPMNVTRAVLPSHAPPAVRAHRHHLVDRGADRPGVRRRLCRQQVRCRGLDGVSALRRRAVRHPHHDRRARVLPHRTARRRIVDDLARAVDRRLRRAHGLHHRRVAAA